MGEITIGPLTPTVIRDANERGQATLHAPTAIMEVHITTLANDLYLSLAFRDGSRLAIPIHRVKELADLSKEVLETIVISPAREAISIQSADIDIYIPGLLTKLYGRVISEQNGRVGGSSKSEAKVAAVRENGRKGGRPRKQSV